MKMTKKRLSIISLIAAFVIVCWYCIYSPYSPNAFPKTVETTNETSGEPIVIANPECAEAYTRTTLVFLIAIVIICLLMAFIVYIPPAGRKENE